MYYAMHIHNILVKDEMFTCTVFGLWNALNVKAEVFS